MGDIAEFFPQAQIVVHEKGARHLADPSRLMASARMVWGDRLDTLFGELSPTESERIVALGDTGAIDLGNGRTLSSHYSPGHAKHHVGLVDSATGDLYVGDAAGVYLPQTGDLRPATPPPDFDLQTALDSIALFQALGPQRLLFSHYGPVGAVQETLERSAEELRVWVGSHQAGPPGGHGPRPRRRDGPRSHPRGGTPLSSPTTRRPSSSNCSARGAVQRRGHPSLAEQGLPVTTGGTARLAESA
ncbi:hypothetical protein GCM10020219_093170 [Nonomuraea dietziae]